MVLIVLMFWIDLEIQIGMKNYAELCFANCVRRQETASMTSRSPCYIETSIQSSWFIWCVIHHFIWEKNWSDLVRKKKLEILSNIATKRIKIQWFLKFFLQIRFSIAWRFLKSNLIIILSIKRNLLFLAFMFTHFCKFCHKNQSPGYILSLMSIRHRNVNHWSDFSCVISLIY